MHNDKQPKLIGLEGSLKGKTYLLETNDTSIGRDKANQIIISTDEKISRHHCRIFTHIGLYWLEDLQSKNGTFITHPSGQELQLAVKQPALLVNSAQIRIGSTRFEILDIHYTQDNASGMVMVQFQEVVEAICKILPTLPPDKKVAYEFAFRALEERLKAVQSEDELIALITRKIQQFSEAFLHNKGQITVMFDPTFELPPLPEDLSQINQGARVDSIRDIFISDIKRCLPPDNDEEK